MFSGRMTLTIFSATDFEVPLGIKLAPYVNMAIDNIDVGRTQSIPCTGLDFDWNKTLSELPWDIHIKMPAEEISFYIINDEEGKMEDRTLAELTLSISDLLQEQKDHDHLELTRNMKPAGKLNFIIKLTENVVHRIQRRGAVPLDKKIGLSDFKLIQTLGQGAFGKVIMAEHIEEGIILAIKSIEKQKLTEDDYIQNAMSERRVLTLGSENRFLTKLHSSFQCSDRVFFVMEYHNGGDLMFHMMESGKFTVERAQFYTAELVLALQFLHSKGIIYRDLKLDNVMLTADGHIKLADFGMTKENICNGVKTNTFCGTPTSIAPEILMELDYDGSVDWWSLGVLLHQMLTGKSPFAHANDNILFWMIKTKPVFIPSTVESPGRELILAWLEKDPSKRLGCREVGESEINVHLFFDEIDWDDLAKGKIEPPFKPKVKGPKDSCNFDSLFTDEPADLPPSGMNEKMNEIAESSFAGFSYYNPKFD